MQAVVVSQPGKLSVETVADPTPGPNELIVSPHAAGICGTDLHIVDGHFAPSPYPIIPGHEFAGEIVALGKNVTGFTVGQPVAVDPSLFCGHCIYCRRQRGNLCETWGATGDTVDGAFAEFVSVPASNAYPIPADMSWAAAALMEPLACVIHGLRRLAMPAGSELLVVGAGTIGLLLVQSALRSGASTVDVIDPDPNRRELALRLGAAHAASTLSELRGGRAIGYEYAVEATGIPDGAKSALASLCRGGTMLIFGVAPANVVLPVSQFQVYNDELTVLGSMAVLNTFESALRLINAGAIAVTEMVTATYPLARFTDALEAVRTRQGLKVQIGSA